MKTSSKTPAPWVLLPTDDRLLLLPAAADAASGTGQVHIPVPALWSQQNPTKLGQALADAMRSAHAKPGRVAIGLPANWVSTQTMQVPSQDPNVLYAAVKMRVQRDYESGGASGGNAATKTNGNGGKPSMAPAGQMAVDYQAVAAGSAAGTGATASSGKKSTTQTIALAAVPRERLQWLLAVCEAAELPVAAVVPAAQAAVAASGLEQGLVLGPAGLEFAASWSSVLATGNAAAASALVPVADWDADPIAVQTQWMLEQAAGVVPAGSLGICRLPGLSDDKLGAASELTAQLPVEGTVRSVDARAWAKAAMQPGAMNLAADRLAHAPKQGRPAWHRQVALAACLLLVLVAWPVMTHWSRLSETKDLEADTEAMQEEVATVQQMHTEVKRLRPWFDNRLSTIGCLHEIAKRLPKDGKVDVTGLRLTQTSTGTSGLLSGIASSQDTVQALSRQLSAADAFANVFQQQSTPMASNSSFERNRRRFEIKFDWVQAGMQQPAASQQANQSQPNANETTSGDVAGAPSNGNETRPSLTGGAA